MCLLIPIQTKRRRQTLRQTPPPEPDASNPQGPVPPETPAPGGAQALGHPQLLRQGRAAARLAESLRFNQRPPGNKHPFSPQRTLTKKGKPGSKVAVRLSLVLQGDPPVHGSWRPKTQPPFKKLRMDFNPHDAGQHRETSNMVVSL